MNVTGNLIAEGLNQMSEPKARAAPSKLVKWAVITGILLVLGGFAFFVVIRQPTKIGPDEHLEFAKAVLICDHGSTDGVWNDLPWFYSRILAFLAPSPRDIALAGRLLTFLCSLACVVGLVRLTPSSAISLDFAVAALLFYSWPAMITLSLSAMVEIPMISFAVLSAAAIAYRPKGWKTAWVVVSGALLGTSVSLKPMALIFFPALFIHFWHVQLQVLGSERRLLPISRICSAILPIFLIWCASALLVCSFLWQITGWQSIADLWNSGSRAFHNIAAQQFRFHPLNNPWSTAALVAAIVALSGLKIRSLNPAVVFYVTWLVSAFGVHLIYVPYWGYEIVHFVPPVVGLGLIGIRRLTAVLKSSLYKHGDGSDRKLTLAVMSNGAVWALLVSVNLVGLSNEARQLATLETRNSNPFYRAIEPFTNYIRYAYASSSPIPAHLGIPNLPELMVLSKKRFLSGNISETDVFRIVRTKRPEVLLLSEKSELTANQWRVLVETYYVPVVRDRGLQMFLDKELSPQQLPKTSDLLQEIGL